MDSQLREAGISYERFPAVRGEEVRDTQEYSRDKAIAAGHELLLGELGCAASHKRIYEKIINEHIPFTLILEDDVELPLGFKEILDREIARHHSKWDYLLFDYWAPGSVFIGRWVSSARRAYASLESHGTLARIWFLFFTAAKACYIIPLSLFEGLRNSYKKHYPGPVSFYRPLYLAGAYLVTESGAQKLLALSNPIRYTADKLPNQARVKVGLRFFAYAPLSVRQRKEQFGSSILAISG